MTLVLASGSTTRAGLLAAAGVPFEILRPQVDEDAIKDAMRGATAGAVASALARRKALEVSQRAPGRLVLGADQVLECAGVMFSKAPTCDAARALLQSLRGRTHRLHTSAVLMRDDAVLAAISEAPVLAMRDFSDGFLADYLAAEGEAVLSSVGCYRLEGRGLQLFERIEGDYFSILGLPLLPLLTQLRSFGILAA